MKKKVCIALAITAFFMLAGFVGGMDMGTLTLNQGMMGSLVSLLVFVVTVKIGGVID